MKTRELILRTILCASVMLGASSALLGCSADVDGSASDGTTDRAAGEDVSSTSQALSWSAMRTCCQYYDCTTPGSLFTVVKNSRTTYAQGMCRRNDRSWVWSNWEGSCSGDITNCNGQLRCNGC